VRLHLCGVRGSTPAPGPDFVEIGGHTSCIAIARDEDAHPTLVLDAGTGLRTVTRLLGERPFDGTILLTHLHWDHTQGLPFFRAGDRPDARVRLLLPEQDGLPQPLLDRWMSPPFFPIPTSGLRGEWEVGMVGEGEVGLEGFTVLAKEIPHKGGRTFGYRVTDGRSSIAYLPDHGPSALGPGPDGWGEYHEAACSLAVGVELLIHDAQHRASELPAVAGFGHSAAEYAAALATHCGAARLLLFHHDPDRTDAAVHKITGEVAAGFALPIAPAAEGTVITIPDH
jgi:phosphoribosyl 1,2-cyclic phosphodiesterase